MIGITSTSTGDDVEHVCQADQLAFKIKSGIEGFIDAFIDLFEEHASEFEGWGLLLVDATNAFNSISWPVAL